MNFDGVFFENADFELTPNLLGKGAFGSVYIIKCLKDGKQYAAKIITKEDGFTGYDQMLLMRESTILHKLNHRSIVKFLGINFQSMRSEGKLEPTIITEYMPNGSLHDILDKETNGLADHGWTPTKKHICLIGIANAMRFLHQNGIIHRDLKPENILMDENFNPKVCDFGLSRCFPESLTKSMMILMTTKIGTPVYMAPELIVDEDACYGQGVDVYAFAILAYEIITGKKPYYELGKVVRFALCKKICGGYRPKLTNDITEKMQSLLMKCWSQKPEERPTFNEIYEELSTNFDYLNEDVEVDEIEDYINEINDIDDIKMNLKNASQIVNSSKKHSEYLSSNLYLACKSENIELVKYILSLKAVDVNSKYVSFLIHFYSVYI